MNRRASRRGTASNHFPPHDIGAERAALAVLLLDPGRIADVAATLEPADFEDQVNRTIYAAMLRLHSAGKPIDVTLVVGELRDSGQYNAEDGVSAVTLAELFRLFPLVRHMPFYVERVAEMSQRRGAAGKDDWSVG
jgi:replicative DNA helicase